MTLFIYKDGELILDRPEILLHPELKAILSRDRGSPGDSDGRKKLQAFKEFTYIYMVCDYNSYPNQKGLSEKETHKYALDVAGLPEDWIFDKEIATAMDFYVEANESIAKELNKELLAGFKNHYKVVKRLRHETEKLLDKKDLTPAEVTQLTETQNKMLNIATELPKKYASLKDAQDLIRKEETVGEIGRGGGAILDSQDPDMRIG